MKTLKKHSIKNSKKAFTLVELVVVIAIIAILAAIAVPILMGIVASATGASGEEQARMLNEKCKTMYSEVRLRTINNTDSKNADGSAVDYAEPKSASIGDRIAAADNVTIENVKAYNGLKSINCDNFYYCNHTSSSSQYSIGTIYYSEDGTFPNSVGCSFIKTNDNLTLGYLY